MTAVWVFCRVMAHQRARRRSQLASTNFCGLDGVRAEVADLVAGAEVLLELPGDDTELVA